ncbi:ThuA domain-containing protein [Mucilaginibacter sabulilitoris]|uniref:ThuA domain-containing protein n=1 Tax=Mucilaginibacter sabulilitoris TaxID=1173583 RepID=A0ABZ0TGT7_9SPHI|nr:ThuA domain-containing protein [Mucilaginibacter sabulilitoris]WPU92411.1 ThuA domain-containing protein [Mucilaginibacter sabulilitoris]
MKNMIASLVLALLCTVTYAQNNHDKLIRVLIVDGFSNHDWRQTTKQVKKILDKSGLFEVAVSTAPGTVNDTAWATWDPGFKNYDVVIQNTNNIQNPSLRWPRRIEEELENYVSSGGGLYILHSANNAFAHWDAYNRMIGMGWRSKETGYALYIDKNKAVQRVPPGEGEGTFHGNRSDLLIHKLNSNPINKGFPNEWVTPDIELYKYARGPAENVTILSYAFDAETNKNWPVEWVVKYGKGNVYASSMGHLWSGDIYPVSYRSIDFQTILIRATEWLAKGKVTYPVPANFPTRSTISVNTEPDTTR